MTTELQEMADKKRQEELSDRRAAAKIQALRRIFGKQKEFYKKALNLKTVLPLPNFRYRLPAKYLCALGKSAAFAEGFKAGTSFSSKREVGKIGSEQAEQRSRPSSAIQLHGSIRREMSDQELEDMMMKDI